MAEDKTVPFIEIDFTAKAADGTVFDTTKLEVAKEHGLQGKGRFAPLVSPLAEGYLLEGLYEFLQGKNEGEYTVEIPAEKAFGPKDPRKSKLISLSKFKQNDMRPYPGLEVDVDGNRGIVRSVNSGRVLVDFNHPMAGKDVVYEVELKRFVTDPGESFKALLQLILNVPPSLVETEQDGSSLTATITLQQQVPNAMFAELARIGVELIDGIDDIKVEQDVKSEGSAAE